MIEEIAQTRERILKEVSLSDYPQKEYDNADPKKVVKMGYEYDPRSNLFASIVSGHLNSYRMGNAPSAKDMKRVEKRDEGRGRPSPDPRKEARYFATRFFIEDMAEDEF